MSKFLFIAGIILVVAFVIAGIASGTFTGFLTSVAGGVFQGAVFFALSMILDNQQAIFVELRKLKKPVGKIPCPKCGREYDEDMNSCPYCGYRE